MKLRAATFVLLGLALVGLALTAGAQDRTQYFRNMVIAPGETVENAVCVFCSVRLHGPGAGNIVVAWGSADIEAPFTGNVVVVGGGIHVARHVAIQGDVLAFGGPVELREGSRVTGKIEAHPNYHFPGQRRVYLRGAIYSVLAITLAFALLALLFPKRRMGNMANTLAARPWLCSAIGVVLFSLIITAFVFAEDFDRWEEAIGAFFLLVLTLLAVPGLLGTAFQIGRKMGVAEAVRGVTAGAIITSLLLLIPVVGFFLCMLLLCVACGVTAASRFGARPA